MSCPVQIETSNRYFLGAMAVLAACTFAFGPLKMFNLYFMPYWINVIWLDVVTYLHHHGSEDPEEKLPWYRGKVGMGCLLEHSSHRGIAGCCSDALSAVDPVVSEYPQGWCPGRVRAGC